MAYHPLKHMQFNIINTMVMAGQNLVNNYCMYDHTDIAFKGKFE